MLCYIEDISVMYCSTTRFQNSFFPSASRGWNLLPVDVRNSSSVAHFKLKVGRIFSRGMKCKLFEVVQDMPLFCIQDYD
jgi:hypothetical protein